MIGSLRNVGIVLAILCLAFVLAFCAEGACGACGHAFCAGAVHVEGSAAVVRSEIAVHVARLTPAWSLLPLRNSACRLLAWEHLALPLHFPAQAAPLRV
jgi:hypothetical protein